MQYFFNFVVLLEYVSYTESYIYAIRENQFWVFCVFLKKWILEYMSLWTEFYSRNERSDFDRIII